MATATLARPAPAPAPAPAAPAAPAEPIRAACLDAAPDAPAGRQVAEDAPGVALAHPPHLASQDRYSAFVRHQWQPLLGHVAAKLAALGIRNSHDAEDIASEACARLLEHWGDLGQRDAPVLYKWLYLTADRVAIDLWRKLKHPITPRYSLEGEATPALATADRRGRYGEPERLGALLADHHRERDAQDEAEHGELLDALHAVASPSEWVIFQLRRAGLSFPEIAALCRHPQHGARLIAALERAGTVNSLSALKMVWNRYCARVRALAATEGTTLWHLTHQG